MAINIKEKSMCFYNISALFCILLDGTDEETLADLVKIACEQNINCKPLHDMLQNHSWNGMFLQTLFQFLLLDRISNNNKKKENLDGNEVSGSVWKFILSKANTALFVQFVF